tara:strand:- start:44 stop:805 length:762 start_codon:yes stop_codon:yes gene_type:complete
MFNISGFIENKINNIVNMSITKAVKLVSPNNLNDSQIEEVSNIILSTPKISKKLARFQSVVLQQAQVGSVMAVNAVIGLIPVPIIPGIIRTTNNTIFQIIKTLDRINDLNDIKRDTIQTFASNQKLIQLLNASGVDSQEIKNKLENLDFRDVIPIVEENLKSGVRNFTEPVKDTMQTVLNAPVKAIDTIGNIAQNATELLPNSITESLPESLPESTEKAQTAQTAQTAQVPIKGGTKKRIQKTKKEKTKKSAH